MRRTIIVLALLLVLLLLTNITAAAMSSANYRMDWFVQMAGAGGAGSSTNYQASYTLGQMSVGPADSTNYDASLGFWSGIWRWRIKQLLPMIRDS
jgi:hypothetical protein